MIEANTCLLRGLVPQHLGVTSLWTGSPALEWDMTLAQAPSSVHATSEQQKRRAKLLRLSVLRFFLAQALLRHDDPNLHLPDSISITFEYQRNDERDAIVTMHCTGGSVLPIIAWASITCCVSSLPNTFDATFFGE
jgi:hypothetical protein